MHEHECQVKPLKPVKICGDGVTVQSQIELETHSRFSGDLNNHSRSLNINKQCDEQMAIPNF